MSHTICAIPGDGIGREVIPAAVAVLQAAVPDLCVEWADAGFETLERSGEALPARTLRLVEGTAATLFGAVSSPLQPTPGYESAILALRRRPESFDVILTTNLFGDILSDVATMHAGGLGLAPSANLGDHAAIFEPVHGSAPDIAGQGIANPLAAILAGVMLLDHIGAHAAAAAVRAAVAATVTGPTRTPDLGGSATTAEVARAVSRQLSAISCQLTADG